MPKPWENAEGYHDPTAYHGTKNMAVAEYFSIDPVWFLIVWYLSDNISA